MTEFYKEKYEELLQINKKLKEEIDVLNSGTRSIKYPDETDNPDNFLITGIVQDISKFKNCEDQVNREKAFLEHLIDSIPEAIAIVTSEGKITKINKEFTNLFDYSLDEAIDKDIDELILPDEFREEAVSIETIATDKHKIIKQTVRRDKSGNNIQVSLIVTTIMINNEIVAYLGIYRDISLERKNQIIQEILYNISTAALNQLDIKDIYPTIVNELSKIWDTNNFFIALMIKRKILFLCRFLQMKKTNSRMFLQGRQLLNG